MTLAQLGDVSGFVGTPGSLPPDVWANRPSTAIAGQTWYATDIRASFTWSGGAWVLTGAEHPSGTLAVAQVSSDVVVNLTTINQLYPVPELTTTDITMPTGGVTIRASSVGGVESPSLLATTTGILGSSVDAGVTWVPCSAAMQRVTVAGTVWTLPGLTGLALAAPAIGGVTAGVAVRFAVCFKSTVASKTVDIRGAAGIFRQPGFIRVESV